MERYTEKHYDGNGYYLICSGNCETFNCGDCGILDKIVDRLAAYEDTGLEPEDFKRTFTEDALLKLTGQLLGVTPDRLRELAQADKEGRCVVLPGGGYKDKDGENALKSAMNTCFYHNNPVTRFIADAVAEKLTRDEAALRRDQE